MFESSFPITIKESVKRRRVSVTVKPNQVLVLTHPKMSDECIFGFLDENRLWIQKQINKLTLLDVPYQTTPYVHNQFVWYLGSVFKINHNILAEYTGVYDNVIQVNTKNLHQGLHTWYADQTEAILLDRFEYWSEFTKIATNSVKLKMLSSKWGSCSIKQNINLNKKLIYTPLFVIDYVIVHELCHVKEMNHSSNFWALVSSFYPTYPAAKKWLKTYGYYLN